MIINIILFLSKDEFLNKFKLLPSSIDFYKH